MRAIAEYTILCPVCGYHMCISEDKWYYCSVPECDVYKTRYRITKILDNGNVNLSRDEKCDAL